MKELLNMIQDLKSEQSNMKDKLFKIDLQSNDKKKDGSKPNGASGDSNEKEESTLQEFHEKITII
jgi:hypothetical protein